MSRRPRGRDPPESHDSGGTRRWRADSITLAALASAAGDESLSSFCFMRRLGPATSAGGREGIRHCCGHGRATSFLWQRSRSALFPPGASRSSRSQGVAAGQLPCVTVATRQRSGKGRRAQNGGPGPSVACQWGASAVPARDQDRIAASATFERVTIAEAGDNAVAGLGWWLADAAGTVALSFGLAQANGDPAV